MYNEWRKKNSSVCEVMELIPERMKVAYGKKEKLVRLK